MNFTLPFSGELSEAFSDRIRYATDASVYKELPSAVIFPKNEDDIIAVLEYARLHEAGVIPRAAGTSLAGQVVGNGLILDTTKYFNNIVAINKEEQFAIVQPGVVRDELNLQLEPYGLFFAPETATSNRCRIGGMVGNNSCGANSLLYGSTRQHILEAKAILSDGSKVHFKALNPDDFNKKINEDSIEGKLYNQIFRLLRNEDVQEEIRKGFPASGINRRSMGYAIDELIQSQPFTSVGAPFNFCTLLAGSEGTLAIITEIKVKLSPLPSPHKALLSVQFNSIEDALQANILALKYLPHSIELIDNLILSLANENTAQQSNRFFIRGNPEAVLIIEAIEDEYSTVLHKLKTIDDVLKSAGLSSYSRIIENEDIHRVWALRKAGLGVMSNMKGDAKPVTVVEDVAILPEQYPAYYKDFKALLEKYDLTCAFYAHISTGELHNKPVFNLKKEEEIVKFRQFAYENALLVKKYNGVLSGEHGDGRLRGEFLEILIGKQNYEICRQVKSIFDPQHILNPGKIVNAPKMNTHLRYGTIDLAENHPANNNLADRYTWDTVFDFSDTDGILRAIEKCNGSADCKKSHLFAGAMCPSYHASLDEKHSTRGRANILREFIAHSNKKNPFCHPEIAEALDLCLACKACKSECPSNVDMTKIRAEFLYHYHKQHPRSLRMLLIANYPWFNKIAIPIAPIYNFICTNRIIAPIFKKIVGFAPKRSLPTIHHFSLAKWAKKNIAHPKQPVKTIYFFNDEFTNTTDVEIGIKAIRLLNRLNYEVLFIDHVFSGRTYLSKGALKKSKKLAAKNVLLYKNLITHETPLIGIEPSAILSFRDEYPDLLRGELKISAQKIAPYCLLIDEFITQEYQTGNIRRSDFTTEPKSILFHSHCYQKALSDPKKSMEMMEIPENYTVQEIKSGCCGMAGAFGYEKEHYDFSMSVGNLLLFPAVTNADDSQTITATGTSCRHQIKDGTGRKSFHPIEILYDALCLSD